MTSFVDLHLDQLRIQQQDRAMEELFLAGDMDGYAGTKPESSDLAYLAGYGSGSRRKAEELLAAIRELLGIKAELKPMEF